MLTVEKILMHRHYRQPTYNIHFNMNIKSHCQPSTTTYQKKATTDNAKTYYQTRRIFIMELVTKQSLIFSLRYFCFHVSVLIIEIENHQLSTCRSTSRFNMIMRLTLLLWLIPNGFPIFVLFWQSVACIKTRMKMNWLIERILKITIYLTHIRNRLNQHKNTNSSFWLWNYTK